MGRLLLIHLTVLSLIGYANCTNSVIAQSTTIGVRAGSTFWSRPPFNGPVAELHESARTAPAVDVFLQRQGGGKWATEWSIGATRYNQAAQFSIFDSPDYAEFEVSLIDLSFSLLRDISPGWLENAFPAAPSIQTHAGIIVSPSVNFIEARWVGWVDGYGAVDGTRRYCGYSAYGGITLNHTVALSAHMAAVSNLAYRFTPSNGWDMELRYPPGRFNWKVGVAYRF